MMNKWWYETFDNDSRFTINIDKIIAMHVEDTQIYIFTDNNKFCINCDNNEIAQNKYDIIKEQILEG